VGEGGESCFPFSANMNAGAKAGFEYRRLGIMPESAGYRCIGLPLLNVEPGFVGSGRNGFLIHENWMAWTFSMKKAFSGNLKTHR
jgi:hypothetical protein